MIFPPEKKRPTILSIWYYMRVTINGAFLFRQHMLGIIRELIVKRTLPIYIKPSR